MAVQDVVAILSVGAVLGGLAFGLYEYHTAQKWKKSEFAARQLEKLSTDSKLALCCQFLDWERRRMLVPSDYAAFTTDKVFVHDWKTLATAMRPEEETTGFNWQEVMYRDYFDHFFGYLERINHSREIRLIRKQDVSSLKYWLEQIGTPRFLGAGDRSVFPDFLEYYGYSGVMALMREFGVPVPTRQCSK
jgi:hypothetical protein